MSLANRLCERREKMNEDRINDFVQMFIPKVEAHVDADESSRHIEVRLEFQKDGKEATLKLNNSPVETFDISNLLGELDEKFIELLNALEDEGFKNKSEMNSACWGEEISYETAYMIGFDI